VIVGRWLAELAAAPPVVAPSRAAPLARH